MEIEVTQENLAKALGSVGRVASSRTGLPILKNILFRTDGKHLHIAATNLELATTCYVGAKISTPGSVTVPAKLITDFVQNLPKDKINIKVSGNLVKISCGSYSSTINGITADEFPELPSIDEKEAVIYSIAVDNFKESVQQTVLAASQDTTRPTLTGVYWHVYEGGLFLAATDGYRLAEKRIMDAGTDIAAIVPASTLQEVLRTIHENDETVEVLFDESQVRFRTGDSEVTSKLIDGNFPDYRQLIPKKNEITAHVDKQEFIRIVKIAALFARDSGGAITLSVNSDKQELSVHSIASEVGENSSVTKIQNATVDGKITLNARYITDMLSVINSKQVVLEFSGSLAPSVFKPVAKKQDYIHVVMPIKS